MNYLGHILLSGNNEQLMTGNFIGDYVKGKKYHDYPEEIQRGIILHRKIDYFTDHCSNNWKNIRERLKPIYGRYAGVVADLFADHILAQNWQSFSHTRLDHYSKWVYAALLHNYNYLPERVKLFLPYLIQHRRLQSYKYNNGIEMSLRIMSFRTSLPDKTSDAIKLLENEFEYFEKNGMLFLNEIVNHFNIDENVPTS